MVLSTVAAGLVLVPTLSHASTDISTKITSAKAQLAKLQDQSEVAAEAYDAGRIKLAAANRVAAEMQTQAAASAARLVTAQQSVVAIATLAYSQGATGDTTMLYQSSDPAGFVDRAALVDSLSRNDVTILASVHAAKLDAQTTSRAAAQAVAAAKALVAALAGDKAQIEGAATAESTVLGTLVAQQQEEIRQAKIALAKAIAAKRTADIRRYRAAQAAAEAAAAGLERERANQLRAAQAFAAAKDDGASTATAVTVGNTAPATATSTSITTSATVGTGQDPGDTGSSTGSGGSSGSGGATSGSVGSGTSSSGSSSAAETAVQWAHDQLGKPYVWAASGSGSFDCSGLTMYVYARAGIYLPHSSRAQYDSGRHIDRGNLEPGDLVFFGGPIHHVGIYIGGGDMIEAPEAGEDVRVSSIDRGDYAGAVRVSG